jgi:hypothetical protein
MVFSVSSVGNIAPYEYAGGGVTNGAYAILVQEVR